MNNSTKTLMQCILILAMPIALSACAKENVSAPVITEASSSCTELLSEIDKQALSNEHKPLDDYFKSRINRANKECPKSFRRDFSIAQLLAASEEHEAAINLLNEIVSVKSEYEIQRLHLLFWIYVSEVKDSKAAEVVSKAVSKAPENLYTKLMESINKCLIGSCEGELERLIDLDSKLHSIPALPYLAQAYSENGDNKSAAATISKAINYIGINGLSDQAMYCAVISNLNIQNDDEAKSIYILYMQAKPKANTAYTQDAKAALDSLRLLDNEE